ncbi:hypothetical protein T08_12917, partial [Trichinella sp. T8]
LTLCSVRWLRCAVHVWMGSSENSKVWYFAG